MLVIGTAGLVYGLYTAGGGSSFSHNTSFGSCERSVRFYAEGNVGLILARLTHGKSRHSGHKESLKVPCLECSCQHIMNGGGCT